VNLVLKKELQLTPISRAIVYCRSDIRYYHKTDKILQVLLLARNLT